MVPPVLVECLCGEVQNGYDDVLMLLSLVHPQRFHVFYNLKENGKNSFWVNTDKKGKGMSVGVADSLRNDETKVLSSFWGKIFV